MTAVKTPALGVGFLLQVGDGQASEAYRTIGGFKTNALAINQAEIDVTDKDGMPWRTLILGGVRSIDASGSGVFSDDPELADVIAKIMAGYKGNFRVIFANGAKFTGAFLLTGFKADGPHDKEQTFSVDVKSAGTITYLAPAPTVSSISPATGAHGSTIAGVTIVGTGFQVGATVKINNVACTVVVIVDGTHITCTAPAQSGAGTYDVVVTNPDAQPSTGGTGLWTST